MYPAVSLAQARQKRDEYYALLAQGIDPQEYLRNQKQVVEAPRFKEICEIWFTNIYPIKVHNPDRRAKN